MLLQDEVLRDCPVFGPSTGRARAPVLELKLYRSLEGATIHTRLSPADDLPKSHLIWARGSTLELKRGNRAHFRKPTKKGMTKV